MAYESRATRASKCAGLIREVAEKLRDISSEMKDEMTDEQKQEVISEASGVLDDLDFGEIESLAEEMASWRDNMSGTNLESTDKYSRVEEAADALENIDVNTREISDVEDIESVADELDDVASELENVDFPGMYG